MRSLLSGVGAGIPDKAAKHELYTAEYDASVVQFSNSTG